MAAQRILERMTLSLEKILALYEAMLEDHRRAREQTDAEEAAAVLERQSRHARRLDVLEKEFTLLLREWTAEPVEEGEESERVRALAARAEEMSAELSALCEENQARAAGELSRIAAGISALRRGKATARRFRADGAPAANYIDKKA